MIILTKAQADAVRGPTAQGAELQPIPLKDGTFVLPENVLSDPDHVIKWVALKQFPRRDVDASEYLTSDI